MIDFAYMLFHCFKTDNILTWTGHDRQCERDCITIGLQLFGVAGIK